jgi:Anti-sigma-K factor rskA
MSEMPPLPRGPRSRPPDFDQLVGEDVSAEERERLRRVDGLLRSVPAPAPLLPVRLHEAVTKRTQPRLQLWTPRRLALALPLAAVLALVAFALGTRFGGDSFEEQRAISMRVTGQTPAEARDAEALIRLGEPDGDGNWPLRLEVSGLPELPPGGYYALWLSKDGEFGATCGSFRVGDGETTTEWDVSYRLDEYDAWVITAYLPDEPRDTERPWVLQADVPA